MIRPITIICITLVLHSCCGSTDISLELKPGLSTSELKSHLKQLAKDDQIIIEIVEGDSLYYKQIEINNNDYKVKLEFNADILGSGPLRSYSYNFAQIDYKSIAPDTSNFYINQYQVFPLSDFDNVKRHLDHLYGKGQIKNPFNEVYDSSFLYQTDEYYIELERGDNVADNKLLKIPLASAYRIVSLIFYAKDHKNMLEAEKYTRRKTISPKEILRIEFDDPKVMQSSQYYSSKDLSGNNTKNHIPNYGIKATNHTYEALGQYLCQNSIIKAKGLLTIKDEFTEVLCERIIVYDFKTPLKITDHGYSVQRSTDYNQYTLNKTISTIIHTAISENRNLNTYFTPLAIVFENGDVVSVHDDTNWAETPILLEEFESTRSGHKKPNNLFGGSLSRPIFSSPPISDLVKSKGRVVVKVCINQRGGVVYSEFDKSRSTLTDIGHSQRAVEYVQNMVFERDDSAPAEECGLLTFIMTASGYALE